MSEAKGILIYAQTTRTGEIAPVVFELASEAAKLAEKLKCEVSAALIGAESSAINDLKPYFDKIYVYEDERLNNYSTDFYSKIFKDLIAEISPQIVLIGATTEGRDLAPRISAALNTGLTADCTALDINENGILAATRPTFGGNLMATILCKNLPQMATVRPKVLRQTEGNKNAQIVEKQANLDGVESRVELLEFLKNLQTTEKRLDEAEIIVAGGKGLKSSDGFKMLEELANLLEGAVGASRAAVDAGWADHSIQVGQTGKTVVPKVYIACAISGAIQHTVGMNGAEKIIAINKDKNAPIFKIADVGVVGDVYEIVPKLIERLKK